MPHSVIDDTEGHLVVTALDFDGCIERKEYDIDTKAKYLASEQDLLNFLEENHTDIILSGSNRTNPFLDKLNSMKPPRHYPGASFNIFPWLATKTRQFDPFLLNDLWAHHHEDGRPYEPGDTIKLIQSLFKKELWDKEIIFYNHDFMLDYERDKVHLSEPDYLQAIWMRDKINIVYAHIHYLANAYPNKKITYQLVDDKKDYLYALSYFYTTHPELVPKNVQIQLIHHERASADFSYLQKQSTYKNIFDFFDFDDDHVAKQEKKYYPHSKLSSDEKKKGTIQGTGMVDEHFDETVKLLAQAAYNPKANLSKFDRHFFCRSIDVEKFDKTRHAIAKNASITVWKGKGYETTFPARFFQPTGIGGPSGDDVEQIKRAGTCL